ncbi:MULTISPECIES: phosphotransferase [unclassified Novosphingobium]|uniref:phosphotransferase n=1 Tax=unclassified Novosphingobium TaxID=2644732 RepID=UPI0025EBB12E|nr:MULTISPECIES: phosphotransferase [unclassified Novosphingobium]HQV02834.1 phosphotransferase [Novosphingobium sp.]
MAGFPTHPADVSPAWMTEMLRLAGQIDGASVKGVRWEPIGTGQVGDSARFHLEYECAGAGPATVAGKFPAADAMSRGTAAAFGLYAKEVGFYREIAPQLGVRVPGVFAAEIADDAVDFILLFEDLGPARGGNQLASCSAADARAGIRQAAAIHAPSWNNEALTGIEWLHPREGHVDQVKALYGNAQVIFRERYGELLEPEFMALCEELNEGRDQWFGRQGGPRSIIHGDFRLDNMLFDIKGGAEEIAVLDWQTVAAGNPLLDIGYFLGTGIGDRLRRAHEDELLNLYCEEMTGRGVPLSRDAIWDDYVLGAIHGISTAVFSAAYVERTERGDANFLSMARGGCALALQHGSMAKLKG